MTDGTLILTRKIQLFIDSKDKEYIGQTYRKLYQWQLACFRAANYIFTHYFIQEQIKELFYITDGARIKLANIKKDTDGILTTSRMNTTYQVLVKHFKGEIPMHILGSLNMTLATHFHNEKEAYLRGEKPIRNYKRDMPIPFRATDMTRLQATPDGKEFSFHLFKIPFRTFLGRDLHDKKLLVERAMAGSIKLRTSSLKLVGGKIFWLATFQVEREQKQLDPTVIAEAFLSLEYPIIVKIGKSRYHIGNKEEFLYRRLAIQAARQRVQRGSTFNRSQHGRDRKLKVLARYRDKEMNYIQYKLHVYSRRLIDICVRHKAATLILAEQEEKEELARQDPFLLRNWGYASLKDKIRRKADKVGITLIVE
jgi:hypothetical protein